MSGRIVSAEEARDLGHADATGAVDRARYQDLTHTVVTQAEQIDRALGNFEAVHAQAKEQAEQIAAVFALHRPEVVGGSGFCHEDGFSYPCPIARALGVTA